MNKWDREEFIEKEDKFEQGSERQEEFRSG